MEKTENCLLPKTFRTNDDAAAAPIPVDLKNRTGQRFGGKIWPFSGVWRGVGQRLPDHFPAFRNKLIQVPVLSLYANQMRTTKCGPSEEFVCWEHWTN